MKGQSGIFLLEGTSTLNVRVKSEFPRPLLLTLKKNGFSRGCKSSRPDHFLVGRKRTSSAGVELPLQQGDMQQHSPSHHRCFASKVVLTVGSLILTLAFLFQGNRILFQRFAFYMKKFNSLLCVW